MKLLSLAFLATALLVQSSYATSVTVSPKPSTSSPTSPSVTLPHAGPSQSQISLGDSKLYGIRYDVQKIDGVPGKKLFKNVADVFLWAKKHHLKNNPQGPILSFTVTQLNKEGDAGQAPFVCEASSMTILIKGSERILEHLPTSASGLLNRKYLELTATLSDADIQALKDSTEITDIEFTTSQGLTEAEGKMEFHVATFVKNNGKKSDLKNTTVTIICRVPKNKPNNQAQNNANVSHSPSKDQPMQQQSGSANASQNRPM